MFPIKALEFPQILPREIIEMCIRDRGSINSTVFPGKNILIYCFSEDMCDECIYQDLAELPSGVNLRAFDSKFINICFNLSSSPMQHKSRGS